MVVSGLHLFPPFSSLRFFQYQLESWGAWCVQILELSFMYMSCTHLTQSEVLCSTNSYSSFPTKATFQFLGKHTCSQDTNATFRFPSWDSRNVLSPLTFSAFNVLLIISLVPLTHGAQFRRGSSLLFDLRGLFQLLFLWFSEKFGERDNYIMPISFPQNKMQNFITYQKKWYKTSLFLFWTSPLLLSTFPVLTLFSFRELSFSKLLYILFLL